MRRRKKSITSQCNGPEEFFLLGRDLTATLCLCLVLHLWSKRTEGEVALSINKCNIRTENDFVAFLWRSSVAFLVT